MDEWNKIKEENEIFRNLGRSKSTFKKPSDFRRAISKTTADQLLQCATQYRTEWDRNIF